MRHLAMLLAGFACGSLIAAIPPAQNSRGLQTEALADSGRRVAMVIGNDGYDEAPLHNAVNDATAMEAALADAGVGFKVSRTLNAPRDRFIQDFGRFIRDIQPGDTVLLYYAGHAIQIDGENYLIPVGFSASTQFEAKNNAISLNYLLKEINRAQARATIVVLDACRNNPYSGTRGSNGLHSVETARGTLIAFAAQPDHLASDNPSGTHGLFTSALLEELKIPGLTIDSVFNFTRQKVDDESHGGQVPFTNTGLLGDFFFRPAPQVPDIGEFVSEVSQIQQLGERMKEAIAARQPGVAILVGKEAVNQCQETRGKIQALTPSQRKQFIVMFEGIYRTLADTLADSNRLGESKAVLALLKSEETFDILPIGGEKGGAAQVVLTKAETKVQAETRGTETNLFSDANEYSALRAKPVRTKEEDARIAILEDELQRANRELMSNLDQIAGDSAPEVAQEARSSTSELSNILQGQPQGTVAIYTLVGEGMFRAILVTPTIRKAYAVPVRAMDLNQMVASWRTALENHSVGARIPASKLYKLLIGPLEKDLKEAGAKNLLWSLDGSLRYIPMGALYDGHSYLAERYRIAVLPLVPGRLMERRERASGHTVIFGVSLSEGGFPPNPGVRAEAQAVHDIEGGRLYLDSAFTRESFISELSRGQYSTVHLATHMALKADAEEAFLLFGDGSHMTLGEMRDMPNLFRGVDMLVFSGSEAVLGRGNDGREIDALSVTAQRMGVRSVLTSLWDVNDESSSVLMRSFYQNLSGGASKAEALRKAQLSMLADPRYADPYYWAAFVLNGDWN